MLLRALGGLFRTSNLSRARPCALPCERFAWRPRSHARLCPSLSFTFSSLCFETFANGAHRIRFCVSATRSGCDRNFHVTYVCRLFVLRVRRAHHLAVLTIPFRSSLSALDRCVHTAHILFALHSCRPQPVAVKLDLARDICLLSVRFQLLPVFDVMSNSVHVIHLCLLCFSSGVVLAHGECPLTISDRALTLAMRAVTVLSLIRFLFS